jgi:hypothetical protein
MSHALGAADLTALAAAARAKRTQARVTEGPAATDRLAKDGFQSSADDQSVAECQTCGGSFDECAYQVIVWGLGTFDSVECAERAMQRRARRASAAAKLAEKPAEPSTQATRVGAGLDDRKDA